ncbi:MAG: DMT family transporter [Kiloniellales bacterium]
MHHQTLESDDRTALGIALIIGSVFLMSFGDALVKYVGAELTLWQIFVTRSLVALPLLVALLRAGGPVDHSAAAMRPKAVSWVILRSLLLVAMWILFYAALPVLDLAVVAAALYSGPLFIALFQALLIREPVGLRRGVALLLGFAGVLIVLRPGGEAFSPMTLLPVAAAALYALAMIVTRQKCLEERPLVLSLSLTLAFLLAGVLASGALALWSPASDGASIQRFLFGAWVPMGLRDWALIALMALLIIAISAGVAKAYQSAPPATIATFDYAYLIFAGVWGFLLFGETPAATTLIGMLTIAAAGLLVLRRPRPARAAMATRRSAG